MHPPTLLSGLAGFLTLALPGVVLSGATQESLPDLKTPTGSLQHVLHAELEANSTGNVLSHGAGPTELPKLRILCLGDSITVGFLSDNDDGDGNGYRLELRERLEEAGKEVVFAGTERYPGSTMTDAYFAAWSGKTIKFINDHMEPSLQQRPNLVLLHAGTNDMNPHPGTSLEGNDPKQAAKRLGVLIDNIIKVCPDAVVLVAVIIGSCNFEQGLATEAFQALIPGVVEERLAAGHHVLTANLSSFPMSDLRDCIHPTNDGYRRLGDYWYEAVSSIPSGWISAPSGPDPSRPPEPENGSSSMWVSRDTIITNTWCMISLWVVYRVFT